ncbi:MAG TPA: transcription elongation factor GreA, partial [Paludibacteraceae bacterium]|nr:transcription elongation factor GreA [Paludibacteraceae bacterium]
MATTYMTAEGYKKLVQDLNDMENVQRPAISKLIAEARDKGDLSENAEYDAAKEAQGMLEMKIAELKDIIGSARMIDESRISTDEVQILTRVKIKNTRNNQIMTYQIVSENEANLKEG